MTTANMTDHHARLVVTRCRGGSPSVYAVFSGEELERDPFVLKRCVEHADRLRRERDPGAPDVCVMTWEQFEQEDREAMLAASVLEEIAAEDFHAALEALPPAKWHTQGGVERFFLGEATKGSWAQQYARRGDRYVTKLADFADPSTWITAEEV